MNIKAISTLFGASIVAFVGPTLNFVWLCTAFVAADFISARLLARRLRRRAPTDTEKVKFSSRKFGATLMTLAKAYAFLMLAHGVDLTILSGDSELSAMRFAAAMICFWQLWSILENEASANDAAWARLAQKILVDKTERHLGVNLSQLGDKHPA